jgi:hypothetical protein
MCRHRRVSGARSRSGIGRPTNEFSSTAVAGHLSHRLVRRRTEATWVASTCSWDRGRRFRRSSERTLYGAFPNQDRGDAASRRAGRPGRARRRSDEHQLPSSSCRTPAGELQFGNAPPDRGDGRAPRGRSVKIALAPTIHASVGLGMHLAIDDSEPSPSLSVDLAEPRDELPPRGYAQVPEGASFETTWPRPIPRRSFVLRTRGNMGGVAWLVAR